jgi:putative DNA primase/helicase
MDISSGKGGEVMSTQAVISCPQAAVEVEPIPTPAPDTVLIADTAIGNNDDLLTGTVNRLKKLSALQYDQVRKAEAEALGVRPSTLDTAVKGTQKEDLNDSPFEEVEPWPNTVDGAKLLTTLAATIRRFIVCDPNTATSAALWIAMCWFIDSVQVAPLAVITAPEKQCGKTLLLTLIGKLTPRPLTSSSISPPALFRSIDLWKPTLLIDETDACLKDNEELRGLINSGHTRDSAFTIRCVGEDHTPTKFSTWGAKALSGIGHIADTLMDRSIILELRRKLPHERVDRIRHAELSLFNELCSKLARFADDNSERVRLARPDLPNSLSDRAQDNWEPLLSIATVAGGDWFEIGTAAALKLSGGENLSLSIGTELLADIHEILERQKIDRISTADLIKELCADDEKPWGTHNKGFQIKPRQIAAMLKGYGIHSNTLRINSVIAKGYEREQFTEAFNRYTPTPSNMPLQSVTALQPAPIAALRVTDNSNVTDIAVTKSVPDVTDNPLRYACDFGSVTPGPASIGTCNVVTDKSPPTGHEILDLTGISFEVTT